MKCSRVRGESVRLATNLMRGERVDDEMKEEVNKTELFGLMQEMARRWMPNTTAFITRRWPVRQWKIARQVWAKLFVRDVLLLLGYLSMASRGCA